MKIKSDLSMVMYAALLVIISFFSISIISPSCKKMDVHVGSDAEIQSRFFNVPANAPSVVHKVAEALRKQNEIGGFIPSFAKSDGYAVWNKSQIYTTEPLARTYGRNGENETTDTVEVFIPIVLYEDNIVNGFFYSRIVGDSVALHLYRANDFDIFPNGKVDSSVVTAELITLKLLSLNENVFGHRKFELLDTNLFKQSNVRFNYRTLEIDTSTLSGRSVAVECGQICYYLMTPQCISPTNLCSFCQLAYCEATYCIPPPLGGGYNWPPDPPIGTGAGGTGGSGGNTGNCTSGNCRPNSTLIAEGKMPCGGCGGGPISVPPDTTSNPNTIDTCAVANGLARKMDTLYNLCRVDSILSTMTGWQNSNNETGVAFYKSFSINPVTNVATLTRYFPGPLIVGSPTFVSIPFPLRNDSTQGAAQMHIHIRTGNAAPSPGDIFALINNRKLMNHTNPKLTYEGTFVAAFNNNRYALAINNFGHALTFETLKDVYFDSLTHDWKIGSTVFRDMQNTYNYYDNLYKNLPDTPRQVLSNELSLAAVLSYHNTGIHLFKRDSTGHFKPIIVRITPHPALLGKKIYTKICP